MPFGPTHDLIKLLSNISLNSFYQSIVSVNSDTVPQHGPIIVASTHWNMIIDPALLSTQLTYGRKLHYWSKNTLFKNPFIRFILVDSGNIPVDRTTKNNQLLFKGTFDVLKLGEAVALFPEGTSYTQPRIMALKDGIGWTALEYAKNLRLTGSALSGSKETAAGLLKLPGSEPTPSDVTIVIVGLNYTDKSIYRSSVQLEYAQPLTITPEIVSRFMSPETGEEKSTVKELVAELERRLRSVTVNASDWTTLWCARLIREMIWVDDGHGPMEHFRENMQTLVEIFEPESSNRSEVLKTLREDLIQYHHLLNQFQTTHRNFDISFSTQHKEEEEANLLISQIKAFINFIFLWPFFSIPALLHLPVYLGGYFGECLQPGEIESLAQNKLTLGMLLGLISIPIYISFLSPVLLQGTSEKGFLPQFVAYIISLGLLIVLHILHDRLVDSVYDAWKRLRLVFKLDQPNLKALVNLRNQCQSGWKRFVVEEEEQEEEKNRLKLLKARGARLGSGFGSHNSTRVKTE